MSSRSSRSPEGKRGVFFWLVSRVYTLWVILVVVPIGILATAALGSLSWVVGLFNSDGILPIVRTWARVIASANFTRVRVVGLENWVPGQAYLLMANHRSQSDIIALAAGLPMQFRFVMKQELRKVPVLGAACAKWGCAFVDRNNRTQAIASLGAFQPALERGVSLIVFPEGTRRSGPELGSFKKGGFMLALQLGLPILPLTIEGSQRVLPAKSLHPRPGTITVRVHAPISSGDYGLERRDDLMQAVRESIQKGTSEGAVNQRVA